MLFNRTLRICTFAAATAFLSGCGVAVFEGTGLKSKGGSSQSSTTTPTPTTDPAISSTLYLVGSADSPVDGMIDTSWPLQIRGLRSLLRSSDGSVARPPVHWNISGNNAYFDINFGSSAQLFPVRAGELHLTITQPDPTRYATATLQIRPKLSFLGATRPAISQWSLGSLAPMSSFSANAFLSNPSASVVDSSGMAYVVDYGHNRISRYSASTGAYLGSIGFISTSTGNCPSNRTTSVWCMGGNFNSSSVLGGFGGPTGIALSADQSRLLVTDTSNNRVVVIDRATGQSLSQWTSLGLNSPVGIATDSSGNTYIADRLNHRIVKADSSGNLIGWIGKIDSGTNLVTVTGCSSPVADKFTPGWCKGGDSSAGGDDGMLNEPIEVALDDVGRLYVADSLNYRISRYDASTGAYLGSIGLATGGNCTYAAAGSQWCSGGVFGIGTQDVAFSGPGGVSIDATSRVLYVADRVKHRITRHDLETGAFKGALGVTTSSSGTCPSTGAAPTWCTGGQFTASYLDGGFFQPRKVSIVPGFGLIVVDSNNHRLVRRDFDGTPRGSVGGSPQALPQMNWGINQLSVLNTGDLGFQYPSGIATDEGFLYVVDTGNARVKKLNIATGELIGSIGSIGTAGGSCNSLGLTQGWCSGGTFTPTLMPGGLYTPSGIAANSGKLYVADTGNHRINRYNEETGAYEGAIGYLTGAGLTSGWESGLSGISFTAASTAGALNTPRGVAIDPTQQILYVVDSGNSRINRYRLDTGAWIDSTQSQGIGINAGATGIAFDPTNSRIIVTHSSGYHIIAADFSTSAMTTLAQSGTGDAMFNGATGIAIDSQGYFYVADSGNNRLQRYFLSTSALITSFRGWFGMLFTVATGGDAVCTSVDRSSGMVPGGWCTGGTAQGKDATSAMALGAFNNPNGVALDSTAQSLFVADTNNHRIVRILLGE